MKINRLKRPYGILGIVTSLYMAIAYLTGIIIFIVVLRYPMITEEIDKVMIIINMRSMVFITNLFMYVLFGPVLILFILYLKSIFSKQTLLIKFSAITGYIWAGSLTASGMINNGVIEPTIRLFHESPDRAIFLNRIVNSISLSIGNGNGEILGGIMTLCFGLAFFRDAKLSKGIGILGLIVGAIGIISLIPALVDLTAVFGILQLVWFVIIGFLTPKNSH